MAAAPVSRQATRQAPRRRRRSPRAGLAPVESQSLLDVVDTLIDKGLALDAEIVLGLADIDLVYLRAGALLAAADRVFDSRSGRRKKVRPQSRVTTAPAVGSLPRGSGRIQAAEATMPLDTEISPGTFEGGGW